MVGRWGTGEVRDLLCWHVKYDRSGNWILFFMVPVPWVHLMIFLPSFYFPLFFSLLLCYLLFSSFFFFFLFFSLSLSSYRPLPAAKESHQSLMNHRIRDIRDGKDLSRAYFSASAGLLTIMYFMVFCQVLKSKVVGLPKLELKKNLVEVQ